MNAPAVSFVDSITSTWNPRQLPLHDFLGYQNANWGSPHYNACETLQHDQLVSLYLDADMYMETQPPPEAVAAQRALCMDAIQGMFEADLTFDASTDVLVGHRHGWVPKKQCWKVSFRFFMPDYHLLLQDVPDLLKRMDTPDIFDKAPYMSKQKLNVPGACKGDGDTRTLQLEDPTQAQWCLAQRIKEGSQRLQGFEERAVPDGSTGKRKRQEMEPAEWEEAAAALRDFGFTNPRYMGHRPTSLTFSSDDRGLPCPLGCGHTHDSQNNFISKNSDGTYWAKNYSQRCVGRHMGGGSTAIVDITPPSVTLMKGLTKVGLASEGHASVDSDSRQCNLVRQHLETCPSCASQHESDLWYIYPIVKQCWSMRNSETRCSERLLPILSNPHLDSLQTDPCSDRDWAELFISEHKGEYLSDATNVYKFDGTRWENLADHKMQNLVQNWLTALLNQLFKLVRYEETMLKMQQEGPLPKEMKAYLDMYKAAQKYLGKESNTKNLLATLKRKLADTDDALKMDKAEYLLGCGDCIVDLKTCTLRRGSPDDLVSMSVGYQAMDAEDPAVATAVEDFMTKVYPLVEERELVRRYFGYCLLAKHNEKVIMFLSDRRQGFNSKSTVMALLELTMGEYAIRTDASMYYKSDKVKSLDDHSAGLLAFEKKRLALLEESSNTVALWEERVKEFNGGGTTITGRGMYSPQMRSFPWITKSLLSANESKLPHFNVEDGALIARLITVPHRSRFVPESEPLPDEPHTYRADPNIKDNFLEWRPYFLRWMLKGLADYHKQGFRDIPETCQAFKRELVAEKDAVQEFLEEAVEVGGADDFVKVKDLYNMFNDSYRTLQKDKKTKKTLKVFESSISRCLIPAKYKSKHDYTSAQGKRTSTTSVYLNYRLVPRGD